MPQGGPPTSYNLGYNSYKWGYNPSYQIIRPFIGVITPFITGRGPPCSTLQKSVRSTGPTPAMPGIALLVKVLVLWQLRHDVHS